VSPIIVRRQTALAKPVVDIAWKAQLRLWTRFRLTERGINRNKIVVAIARLERGSSVTYNSLAANQRPHISSIDRRHR
jgi:hypothetical protein